MKICKERKRYVSGAEVVFECELVALEDRFGILKYVIDRHWTVQGLKLGPGTITYAFYWMDRLYNLYWWLDENGKTIGYYFNVADSLSLSAREFIWRDLIVDVLVFPNGQVQVVDEDEVPDAADEGLKSHIESGKRQVLQNYRAVIEEVNRILSGIVDSIDEPV